MTTRDYEDRAVLSYSVNDVKHRAWRKEAVPITHRTGVRINPNSGPHSRVRVNRVNDQFGGEINTDDMLAIHNFGLGEDPQNRNYSTLPGWFLVFDHPTQEQIDRYGENSPPDRFRVNLNHIRTPNYSNEALTAQNLHKHSIDASLKNICEFQEAAIGLTDVLELMIHSVEQQDLLEPTKEKMVRAKNEQCKLVMTDLISDGIVKGLVMHSELAHKIAVNDSHTAFAIDGHSGTLMFGDRMRALISTSISALFDGDAFNYSAGNKLHSLLASREEHTIPTAGEMYVVATALASDSTYNPESWQVALSDNITN